MRIGYTLSGVGHVGLIVWVLFGGVFSSHEESVEITEVSVISGAEFEALMQGVQSPDAVTEMAMPVPPAEEESAQPQESQPDAPPPVPEPPQVTETPPPDAAPEAAEALPPVPSEVTDEAPEIAPPPQEDVVLAPPVSDRPVPRPAERVAPEPVAPPEPDAQVADTVTEEAVPDEAAETPQEEAEAAAPEETTTRIVTEATEAPSSAPTSSVRPRPRPARSEPVETPDEPVQQATPAPTPEPDPAPAPSTSDAVNDALRQALTQEPSSGAPASGQSGPPMTSGQRDALRVAVQQCWNVGSLSSDALRTTVVVAVSMTEDGRPMNDSLRMLSYEGGSAEAARQAFESARRAIIRCGANGFSLPRDKYDQWRDIEMTFNPENMRIR